MKTLKMKQLDEKDEEIADALNISKIPVMGISAGAPSTVQFALRYPERVSALVLLVPGLYTPEPATDVQSVAFPFILAGILKWDYPLWAAMKLNPQMVLSTMGVPPLIQKQLSKEKQVELMNWLPPYDTRIPGIMMRGLPLILIWNLTQYRILPRLR